MFRYISGFILLKVRRKSLDNYQSFTFRRKKQHFSKFVTRDAPRFPCKQNGGSSVNFVMLLKEKRHMWSIAGHLNWTLNKYNNQPSSTLICYVTLDSDLRNVFLRNFTAELHQTYLASDTGNIRALHHSWESISTPGPCQCESHKSGHSWIDPYLTQRFSKVSKGWAVKQELIRRKVVSKNGEWGTL